MAGDYPWGVTDNDPHFDCPSTEDFEDSRDYKWRRWLIINWCDACRFGNHAACQVAVDPCRPLDICKCDRCHDADR